MFPLNCVLKLEKIYYGKQSLNIHLLSIRFLLIFSRISVITTAYRTSSTGHLLILPEKIFPCPVLRNIWDNLVSSQIICNCLLYLSFGISVLTVAICWSHFSKRSVLFPKFCNISGSWIAILAVSICYNVLWALKRKE